MSTTTSPGGIPSPATATAVVDPAVLTGVATAANASASAAANTTALAVQAAVQGAVDAHAAVTPAMAPDGTTVAAVAAVHAGAVSGAQAVADQVIARVQKAAMAVPGLAARIEADAKADVAAVRADLTAGEARLLTDAEVLAAGIMSKTHVTATNAVIAALALAVVSVALTWWFLVPHAAAIHG